jgi:hypothetical protein
MKAHLLFKPEAALRVRCPRCSAGPGEPCRGHGQGKISQPHTDRRIALVEARRVAKPVSGSV